MADLTRYLITLAALGIAVASFVGTRRNAKRMGQRALQKRKPPTGKPTAAVIEIIERGATTQDTAGGSVIVPDDIRINGQSLLAPAEAPVIVHEMSTRADDAVRVTLTLFARRVSIRAENDQ